MPSNAPVRSHTWDQRFLRLARKVALWSKDPSTQCGAILVRPDNTIASVGFNGFPFGMKDDVERYNDRAQKYPRVMHSEWNAIRSCRDASLEGYTVYAWPMPPCDICTNSLVQKGIARVVCPQPAAEKLERWKDQFVLALGTLQQKQVIMDYQDIEGELLPEPVFEGDIGKWDARFLAVAQEVQSWSKDTIDPRGALIVRPDKTVCSFGINGFAKGVDDTPLLQGDAVVRKARLLEAENNAILFSKDPQMDGYTVYTWPAPPALRASSHLIHEGIRRLVAPLLMEKPGEGTAPVTPAMEAESLEAWLEVGGVADCFACSVPEPA